MIVGLGMDLVDLSRIARIQQKFGSRFQNKILTAAEIAHTPQIPATYLAGRFAAKEAAVKALGTGFRDGLTFLDIEILPDRLGKPELKFLGNALKRSIKLGVRFAFLSITHEKIAAAAVVVLEA